MENKSNDNIPDNQAFIKLAVTILDSEGNEIKKEAVSSFGFPSISSFDRSTMEGFRADFDVMEKAALEVREAIPDAMSDYLNLPSKKNQTEKPDDPDPLKQK